MASAVCRLAEPLPRPRSVGAAADRAPDADAPQASPAGDAAASTPARGRRTAALAIRHEAAPDYGLLAALATEGFDAAPDAFRPETLRWLYETAFTDGTTVLAAHAGERKVGHIALVHQTIVVAGRRETAVALVDLFILKDYRSKAAMARLYGAVEAFCLERAIRFIVAVPNGKAAGVNTRYLGLARAATLEIRVGLAGLPRPWRRVTSHRVAALDEARGMALMEPYCGGAEDGLLWTAERLWARLQKPDAGYALHLGRDVLLVSAPRRDRRAAHVLLCALLARPGSRPGRGEVAALVAAACRLQRRPLFVYAGINDAVPLPGVLLPARMRPSPMILQLRDFRPGESAPALSRFEALDFDFA